MMGLFKKPTVEKYSGHGIPNIANRSDHRGTDFLQVTDDEWAWMQANWALCPDCGSKLLGGPEGGAAQNCPCSNTDCRSEFTLGGWSTAMRNDKLTQERHRWYGIPDVSVGWSDFALGRHKKGSGFSYFDGTDQELFDLIDLCWLNRVPGAGRKDLTQVVLVPVLTEKFVGNTINLNDIPQDAKLQLSAEVSRRQEHEDPFIKIKAEGVRTPLIPFDGKYFSFTAPPKEKISHAKVVLYHKDTLLENNGTRSTDKDWEIVAIIASAVDDEPMHPLAMARNFLKKPGGTFAPYTAEQFAEAIYYWSQRVGMD